MTDLGVFFLHPFFPLETIARGKAFDDYSSKPALHLSVSILQSWIIPLAIVFVTTMIVLGIQAGGYLIGKRKKTDSDAEVAKKQLRSIWFWIIFVLFVASGLLFVVVHFLSLALLTNDGLKII